MTKIKQATLFSLKSWKNVAADSIQKYKDILANLDEDESEILKALVSLKRKNPSRDVILSAKIDLSLELLERHQNPKICLEAHMLRNHWQLNKNCTSELLVVDEEPPAKKCRKAPVKKIFEFKQNIECKMQPIDYLQEKDLPCKTFLIDTNKSLPSTDIKPTKLVSKQPPVNRTSYNNVMRQLYEAVKLFTQELGEQEVRLYLEKKS